MWPESTPGSSARNGGSPCDAGHVEHPVGAPLGDRGEVGDGDGEEVQHVGRPARRGSCRWTRPGRRACTTGLSIAAASSRAATGSACASVSRAAPCTCGAQRSEYASCTRVQSGSRWLAMIAESASSARRLAALRAWPGCGRSACRSAANTASVPSSASTLIAAATSAVRSSCVAGRAAASTSMPSMPSVPLISARPSFSASTTGVMPGRGEGVGGGRSAPSASRTSPSPITASAQCGQRGEVARAAERAVLVHDRGDAGVEQGGVGLRRLGADAGAAGGQRRQPQQHQRPHDLALDLGPGAGRVRADQRCAAAERAATAGCAGWPARRSRSRRRSAARRRGPAPRSPSGRPPARARPRRTARRTRRPGPQQRPRRTTGGRGG